MFYLYNHENIRKPMCLFCFQEYKNGKFSYNGFKQLHNLCLKCVNNTALS